MSVVVPYPMPEIPQRQISNIEVEEALLGALLINNRAVDRIARWLKPSDFFDAAHAIIYE